MYRLEVSAAIRHIYMSLGFKSLSWFGTSLLHIKKKQWASLYTLLICHVLTNCRKGQASNNSSMFTILLKLFVKSNTLLSN